MSVVGDDQQESGLQVAELAATASAALGRRLTSPVTLSGGSARSTVLRCQDPDGGSVIVKTYPKTAEGASSFSAEAAGLVLATGTELSPDLLAVDAGALTVVMSDLGSGQSLADVLLGTSAEAARSALLDWAGGCGRLSARVRGRQAEFGALQTRYLGGRQDESYLAGLADRIRGAGERAVTQLGVTAPAGLDDDLADVAALAASAEYLVFSPGDICPDNNMLTGAGIRFLDFESAGFHSVFLDAAYIRMPFSTCWCVFRLPAELSAAAESHYREQVCLLWPELADDSVWRPGVRRAVAAWSMSSMWWLLARSVDADVPLNPEQASPHTRQLIRYRWQTLAAELEWAGDLPALARLTRSLLTATEGWQAAEMPLYPALR